MRQFDTDTTICAVASGNVSADRGIIRISGPDAVLLCGRWLTHDLANQLATLKSAKRIPVNITVERFNQTVSASVFIWPNTHSYTGQPSVEIHTAGSPLLLELMVEQLISGGAKLAQPGEFTYRAFLGGRLDLTQCEAVLAVINSTHEKALDISLRQLAGGLSQPLALLRTDLINLLADLEAGLDFVEEDIQFVSSDEIQIRLESALQILDGVLAQLGTRRTANRSPKVVLAGLPNAGKSSLINALSGNDIAIVSQQSGTTRDFLRATYHGASSSLDLIDTAGLDAEDTASESIQSKSQRSTQAACADADLILYCHDITSGEVSRDQIDWLGQWNDFDSKQVHLWLVLTKSDLAQNASEMADPLFDNFVSVSSISGEGIQALKESLDQWALQASQSSSEVVPMTLVRCADSVVSAKRAISEALRINSPYAQQNESPSSHSYGSGLGAQEELIAAEVRIALHELGAVVGEIYTDDILDALFSRFCIGK